MIITKFLFVQLLFLCAASFQGNNKSDSDQRKSRNEKVPIGRPMISSRDNGTKLKKDDHKEQLLLLDDVGGRGESESESAEHDKDIDINAILGTVGMPKCIDRCIKSLSKAMGRLLQFNETLDKFDTICSKYEEAVTCIHEKVLCSGSNIFEVITSGVLALCRGTKRNYVQNNKVCLDKHLDKVAQGCDQKCHLARALAHFSHRSNLRGAGLVHLLAVVNADSGPVCSAADCFLHCFREDMNQKCAQSGGVITDGLLRPFFYLANLIQKSGRAMRSFLEDKLPKECKFLTKKKMLDKLVKS